MSEFFIKTLERHHHSSRNRNSQAKEPGQDKHTAVDSENPVESVPEDLAGKVCYELEPLVLS